MCCHLPLNPKLGGAKVYIEAAKVYSLLGHDVKLIGVDEIVGKDQPYLDEAWRLANLPLFLKKYIEANISQYDVVEYESLYLPVSIESNQRPILVARSVLLDLHLKNIQIPRFQSLKSFFGHLFKGKERQNKIQKKWEQSLQTMHYSDFINVPNPTDAETIQRSGISKEKIIIQPYGVFESRFATLKLNLPFSKVQKIAFVGTFDNRKGAVEFPEIIKLIIKRNPNVKFKLMGVVAMFNSAEAIYEYLGKDIAKHVEIVESFQPEELPTLLSDCQLGIFPSYLESFGFGVLEMMASGLPVVSYDCPGINMIVPKELQVKTGDHKGLVSLLNQLINDEKKLAQNSIKVKEAARTYIYEHQENIAIESYLKKIKYKSPN